MDTFKPCNRLCAEPCNVSAREGDVGGFIISSFGANPGHFTLTVNFGGKGVVLDR